MSSIVGVGITPPKVLGTPKPASSVMISRMFGASFGGTMRGAHQGVDCRASSLITPPNAGSGAGSCRPSMVVVALGDPMVPVTSPAKAGSEANPQVAMPISRAEKTTLMTFLQGVSSLARAKGASTRCLAHAARFDRQSITRAACDSCHFAPRRPGALLHLMPAPSPCGRAASRLIEPTYARAQSLGYNACIPRP